METRHGHKCLNCDYTAKTSEKLEKHVMMKHTKREKSADNTGFYCDVCGEKLANAFRLQQHMQIHDETRWPCPECKKVFNRQYNLYIHKKQVHSGKTFLCQICARPFTCQRNLRSHIQIVHTSDEDKPYKCSMCTKGFTGKNKLDSHMSSVHYKDNPNACRYGCGRAYNDISNRNQHERKTHGSLHISSIEAMEKANYTYFPNGLKHGRFGTSRQPPPAEASTEKAEDTESADLVPAKYLHLCT